MIRSAAIRRAVRWGVPAAKVWLRARPAETQALALYLELRKARPRIRLVKWLCDRIAQPSPSHS